MTLPASLFAKWMAPLSAAIGPSTLLPSHDQTAFHVCLAYASINTAGAVSRSKAGTLFVAGRGLGGGIEVLEPSRKMLASSFNGEPFECIGGVLNDLSADAKGGVYFSVTGAAQSGVFYASPNGVVSRYGKDVPLANGIILSPDEK